MKCIDCHVHLPGGIEAIDRLVEVARALDLEQMNVACIPDRNIVNTNPPAFVAKRRHPGLFYVFAGLDHAELFTKGAVKSLPLAEQAERLAALGADGIKMLETKPTCRKWLGEPGDGPYYAPFFARVEALGLPILWHTADPEEFWDRAAVPAWASSRGWDYDASFPTKASLYAEAERVLNRHPRLKVIFPHFYFLSADLPHAERLLARFPNVSFDLAPGVELIYNLSKDPAASREFFIRHADRIMYGTDIGLMDDMTVRQSVRRAVLVRRFLSSGESFGADPEVDFLFEPPPGAVGKGLDLPADVLQKIFHANFEGLAGARPKPLDVRLAREECLRLAASCDKLPGDKPAGQHSARAAEALRQ